jgi:GTP cyclohydrolase I
MSYNKTKTDFKLGAKIQKHLEEKGVQTPVKPNGMSRSDKINSIEHHYTEIMKTLGLDLTDDSLEETPKRVAKLMVNEVFWGLEPDAFPKCTAVENKMHYDEMVIERNINVQSNCEHHFVVIDGFATVGYIPNKTVLGLSKINRIVEYFAKRPQIQERLTEQIYHAMAMILDTENVGVIIDAEHFCVKSRGVEDVGSSTVTTKLGGVFKSDPATRAEFMAVFHNNNRC